MECLKQGCCLFDLQTFLMNIDLNSEDEVEQLRASVDFLVDLCDTVSPVRGNLVTFLMSLFMSLSDCL